MLPASWTDALQELLSGFSTNLRFEAAGGSVALRASAAQRAGLVIGGKWRWVDADIVTVTAMTFGTKDIYAVASANSFSNLPEPDTDTTDYTFGIQILASPTTPSGNHNGKPIAHYLKLGTVTMVDSIITSIDITYGPAHAATPRPPADASVSVAKTGTGDAGLARGSFSAHLNANSTALEPIVFNTEAFDQSNWYSTSTGRFTPQVAGIYRLTARVEMNVAPNATDNSVQMGIVKNGGVGPNGNSPTVPNGGSTRAVALVSALVQANGSTDYFDVRLGAQGYAATPSVKGHATLPLSYFQGELVGRA